MRCSLMRVSVALAAVLFCSTVQAHPGHGNGFMAGVLHPLLGLDHLIAMTLVGVWAAQLGGHARWLVPASFVAVMALFAAVAMAGIGLPIADSGVATSVLLIGLLIGFSVRVGPATGAAIVGIFAICHGYMHGLELPAMTSPWQYAIGFVCATALLHAAGLLVGIKLRERKWLLPATGIAALFTGGWLLAYAIA